MLAVQQPSGNIGHVMTLCSGAFPPAISPSGEEFLDLKFRDVSKFGSISFAYLDNYDWIWAVHCPHMRHSYSLFLRLAQLFTSYIMHHHQSEHISRPLHTMVSLVAATISHWRLLLSQGEHPESYSPQFPEMIRDDEMSAYKLKMRKEYEAEGYVLNNGRSQAAHLAQAKLVYSMCTGAHVCTVWG